MSSNVNNESFTKLSNLDFIVFDLDYTLWPFWVDTHVTPPFKKKENGKIVDAYGHEVKYYPEVPEVLEALTKAGYKLGVASRTSAAEEAYQLISLFGWKQYFTVCEIYPGSKVTHFNEFNRKTKIAYERMLFFDDEYRNIKDLNAKGVVSILVNKGVSKQVVKDGILEFEKKRAAKNSLSKD